MRRYGDSAFVVDVRDSAVARELATTIRERDLVGVRDVVGAICSVLVVMDEPAGDPDVVIRELEQSRRDQERRGRRRTVSSGPSPTLVIPAVFDGADLHEVASIVGIDADGIVADLVSSELLVEAVGFSPGFAYLSGLSETLRAIPRRSVPRPKVEPGSVALAGGFAAVYPQASPGGWQILGCTALRLFDPSTAPYAVLRPGDRVRFEPRPSRADAGWQQIGLDPRPAIRAPAGSSQSVLVEEPGPLTTLQDHGRSGYGYLGVPESGPADAVSHRLANQLVGNEPTSVALEATLRGPTLVFAAATYVAAVGGGVDLEVDGRPVGADHVVPVAAGQRCPRARHRHGRSRLPCGGRGVWRSRGHG